MLFVGLLCALLSLSFADIESQEAPPAFALSNPQNQSNEVFQSYSFGHLLTTNNNVLAKDQFGVGLMYLGYGITDNWSVATSPFVGLTFEMFNILSRYVVDLDAKQRVGLDIAYFKTINEKPSEFASLCPPPNSASCIATFERQNGYKTFKMEAVSVKATYSNLIKPKYRLSTTLGYFYYFDDTRPFSLRMDPQNNDKYAVSLSTLHEFRTSQRNFLNLEFGLWGLNYEYLYYHTGFSVNHQTGPWLWSFGFTTTWSPTLPRGNLREFNYYDSRGSLHPEIQIQRFF
jgi:hypothetical protein